MPVCVAGGVRLRDGGDTDGAGVVGSGVDGRFDGAAGGRGAATFFVGVSDLVGDRPWLYLHWS